MIGKRFILARNALGLTQEQAAKLSGIPSGTISHIELGSRTPSDKQIESFSSATLFPVDFFVDEELPAINSGSFRKLSRLPAKTRNMLIAQITQVALIVERAQGVIRFPDLVPLVNSDDDIGVSDYVITRMAHDVRRSCGLGGSDPVGNAIRLCERKGCIVVRLPINDPNLDGYSTTSTHKPIIALLQDKPGDRDRASVIHELAHCLLNHNTRYISDKDAEKEAWALASEILFPSNVAKKRMSSGITLNSLIPIKAEYGVSIAFLVERAYSLEIINEKRYISLRKQLMVRKWNKQEPVFVGLEKPSLLPKIIKGIIGDTSIAEGATILSVHPQLLASISSA